MFVDFYFVSGTLQHTIWNLFLNSPTYKEDTDFSCYLDKEIEA